MSGYASTAGGATDYYLPEDQEVGIYAETVAVWHTRDAFVLDFGALQMPVARQVDESLSAPELLARVASRVRVPATLVFELISTISGHLETYEAQWGEIRTPELRDGA
jgi:hypothetical protein